MVIHFPNNQSQIILRNKRSQGRRWLFFYSTVIMAVVFSFDSLLNHKSCLLFGIFPWTKHLKRLHLLSALPFALVQVESVQLRLRQKSTSGTRRSRSRNGILPLLYSARSGRHFLCWWPPQHGSYGSPVDSRLPRLRLFYSPYNLFWMLPGLGSFSISINPDGPSSKF